MHSMILKINGKSLSWVRFVNTGFWQQIDLSRSHQTRKISICCEFLSSASGRPVERLLGMLTSPEKLG